MSAIHHEYKPILFLVAVIIYYLSLPNVCLSLKPENDIDRRLWSSVAFKNMLIIETVAETPFKIS